MKNLFKKQETGKKTETIESQILDEKLKEKIKSESHKYDFKVIKRKLKDEDRDNTYLSHDEISTFIRQP